MLFGSSRFCRCAAQIMVTCLLVSIPAAHAQTASDASSPAVERVAVFNGAMPTGVTVSHTDRIFVCFPRWGDPVPYTVAEVVDAKTRAYPSAALNVNERQNPAAHLVSVQSVVVDPKDRLWLLDTGSIQLGPTPYGGPKLVGVDLTTNKVFKTIIFPRAVVPATTYLNDIRFDLRRGTGGLAFITDSGDHAPNGIIVVDLATGKSWRHLEYQPSARAEPHFVPVVEGQPLMNRPKNVPPTPLHMASDGIAISNDGKRLYYCPLAARELYSVSINALAQPKLSEHQVAATIEDLGRKGASDGLEQDAEGRVYASDYEHHSVRRGTPGGPYDTLFVTPRVLDWPDTMSLATNGYLYLMANEFQRQPNYHNGHDLRVKPYVLYRVRVDAEPVLLR